MHSTTSEKRPIDRLVWAVNLEGRINLIGRKSHNSNGKGESSLKLRTVEYPIYVVILVEFPTLKTHRNYLNRAYEIFH